MKFSKEIKESKHLCDEIAKDISKHIFDFIFKEALEIVQTSFTAEKLNEQPQQMRSYPEPTEEDNELYPKYRKFWEYTIKERPLTEEQVLSRAVDVLTPKSSTQLILQQINRGNIFVDKNGVLKVKKSSARLTKAIKEIGGKWDSRKRAFKIDLRNNPNILQVQTVRLQQIRQNLKRLDDLMVLKQKQIEEKQGYVIPEEKIDAVISDLMEKSLVAIPEPTRAGQDGAEIKIGIKKEVNEETLRQFKEEYLDDTKYPIKDMESRAVERIRKCMLQLTMEEGLRQEEIAEALIKEFGMTERHALFLARQEAKLIKAKIARDRALKLGYTDYIWQTNIDGRERPLHRALNGQRCSFLSPPIIDEKGTRGNPGEAFSCRCLARIITDE